MQDSKGPRVLVVEDDYLVRILVQGLIEELGFAFAGGVGDGREVVEAVKLLHPDVIIMDIAMRDMDGIEATRLVQAECPTPVVALTAFESAEMVQRASDAGMGAYLVKPPSAAELERAISIAMARFGDMQEAVRLRADVRQLRSEVQALKQQLRVLEGLVPCCGGCGRVLTPGGSWEDPKALASDGEVPAEPGRRCPECASA